MKLLDYTPLEALYAATTLGGVIMMQPDKLGKVAAGYKADVILVDGNPVEDITILQDRARIPAVMKDGIFHRDPAAQPPPR